MTNASRVALVTGGGSGMGRATSLRFARNGMAVAVLDIDAATASAVAEEIQIGGGSAIAATADISDRAQVERAVADVRHALGPITVLVNNAAVESFTPFADIHDAGWDRLMNGARTRCAGVVQALR